MFIATAYLAFLDNTPAYQTVITAVTNQLSEANLTTVLTYSVTTAIGLVFFWWAVRKVVGVVKRAFMRGKLRL